MDAGIESLQQLLGRGTPAPESVPLDPTFPYLRTTMGGRVGFVWLGNTERSPRGPVEVYYSSSGEVLRLHNGRITSAVGFPTEWRKVEWPDLPSWASISKAPTAVVSLRRRDVMPGYRTGVSEELTVRTLPPPSRSPVRGVDVAKLSWFEERARPVITSGTGPLRVVTSDDALPPARYAVKIDGERETVVYSEQCLSKDFCFTWQRWSAAMQDAEKLARDSSR